MIIGDIQNKDDFDSETEAHFQDIQNNILKELDAARVSITVVMAWFTNDVLGNKLIEKYK